MTYWLVKAVFTLLLRLFYRVKVTGAHHVPKDGPVIIAANHQSFIDSVFLPVVLRRRVTFVGKAEYFENRKTAWFLRRLGMIPLKRDGGDASQRALATAAEVLAAGGVLGIYPEGTRTPDGRLYKGHTGVARLAIGTGAAVVPAALIGTSDIQPIGVMWPHPWKRVTINFGPPLHWGDSDGATGAGTARRLTDELMKAIAALSGQTLVGEYAKRKPSTRPAAPAESVQDA